MLADLATEAYPLAKYSTLDLMAAVERSDWFETAALSGNQSLQTITSAKKLVHSSCSGMDIEHRGLQKINGLAQAWPEGPSITAGRLMTVKRIAALGAVLLTASACSRLRMRPAAYSSLPPATMHHKVAAPAPAPAISAAVGVFHLPVIVPGTLKKSQAGSGQGGVNPTAVLEASMRSHMAWEPPRPADLLKPPALETVVALTYNREATMDRLVKAGRDAAKPICSGC